MPMLYYANGGPGPPSKLLRVDAPEEDADVSEIGLPGWSDEMTRSYAWILSPAERWTVAGGWEPDTQATADIYGLGEFGMVDARAVPKIQADMRAGYTWREYVADLDAGNNSYEYAAVT